MSLFKNQTELIPNIQTSYSIFSTPVAGEKVTMENAMQIPAFNSCVQILSETIGMIPIHLIKSFDNKTTNLDFYKELQVLTGESNDYMTGDSFRRNITSSYLLTGNGYAEKEKALDGSVMKLHYINPDRCTKQWIDKKTNQIRYLIDGKDLGRDKIFHIPSLMYSKDGFSGVGALDNSKEIISLALAQLRFSASYFGNGALPTTILKTSTSLTPQQRTDLLSGWNLKHKGAKNAGKTAILPPTVTEVQVIGNDAEKSQLNESRKQTVIDICRLFRMPPHLVQSLEGSTFSNIEEQAREFIEYTLMPHIVNWEKCCRQQLLKDSDKSYLYYKFNLDSLSRGKLLERYQAHNLALQGEWKTKNEIRMIEDLDIIKELDNKKE